MKFVLSQAGLRQIFTAEGMKFKHSCRVCATPMGEANKGFDYRCADCHKKEEGWC